MDRGSAIASLWDFLAGFPAWAGMVLWPVARIVLVVLAGFAGGCLFVAIVKQAAFNSSAKHKEPDIWSL